MFGFLKDKLKKAINAFSKSVESEVKEEKVDDSTVIEEAKREEKKRLETKKPIAKEPTKKEAPKKDELKKAEPKTVESKRAEPKTISVEEPARKASEKTTETKEHGRPAERPAPVSHSARESHHVPVSHPPASVVHQKTSLDSLPEKDTEKKLEKKTTEKESVPVHKPAQTGKYVSPEKKPASAEPPKKAEKEERNEEKKEEKKGFFSKLFGKKKESEDDGKTAAKAAPVVAELETLKHKEEEIAEKLEDLEHELIEDRAIEEHAIEEANEGIEETEDIEEAEAPAQKSGFFGKLKEAFTKKTLTDEKFDELFWELELAMLENNVAVEVIEKIKNDLKDELTSGKVSRMGIEDMITTRLRQSVEELFDVPTFDFLKRVKTSQKPFKICMIGVNGAGKTTTLAKLVYLLKKNDLSVVLAASDTFRAAAIDQLQEHADRLGVKLISQGYNADPAAVAFDAIKHAESKGIDVVIIDTAGRLHSNTNLMAELEKVVRVSKPDLKIFIGESITGNDCVEQATVFDKLVGIDAIILSKADIDEKGGAAISVSYVTGKPILYLGMGQTYDDLVPFDKEKIIDNIF